MTPWTAAYQAPPAMGFSRQEDWSGVPLPSPEVAAKRDWSCVMDHCRVHTWDWILWVCYTGQGQGQVWLLLNSLPDSANGRTKVKWDCNNPQGCFLVCSQDHRWQDCHLSISLPFQNGPPWFWTLPGFRGLLPGSHNGTFVLGRLSKDCAEEGCNWWIFYSAILLIWLLSYYFQFPCFEISQSHLS